MAGRPRKTEGERKAASVRLEEDIVLEIDLFAKVKGKSLGELMGDVVLEWWKAQPEREKYRALVAADKPKEAKASPIKKSKSASA